MGFDECLRQVARAHGQELDQLRAENERLRLELALAARPRPPEPPRGEPSSPSAPSSPSSPKGDVGVVPSRQPPAGAPPELLGISEVVPPLPGAAASVEGAETATLDSGGLGDGVRRNSSQQQGMRFELIPQWEKEQVEVVGRSGSKVASRKTWKGPGSNAVQRSESAAAQRDEGPRSRCISYPGSHRRLAWDLIGAVLILYDLFTIPLGAFSPPVTTFLLAMDWTTLVFWTLNMPMSLQVGFIRDGAVVMDFNQICGNYLRTWFIPDLAVVLPDWVITLLSLGSAKASFSPDGFKLLRMLRLVRMVRLLRLLKLGRILRSFNDLIETEYTNIFVNIVKMILLLLVINHYIGCFWYLIGTSREGDDTWVVHHQLEHADWSYRYLTAFHWAITQFTPASMHVQPQNFLERLFAILVVVFALVCFSYVVGSITGSLTQLRGLQEESYKQFWMMRRYLKQNQVPFELSSRVTRYLDYAWQSQRQNVEVKDSKIFALLSEQLQSELRCEIWMPFLRAHELFSELANATEVSKMCVRRIAATAMQRKSLAQGDAAFFPEKATHMYIVISGCMRYVRADAESEERPDVFVRPKEFAAEPVLWALDWVHLGMLTAASEAETEVLTLDPKMFLDVMIRSPDAYIAAAAYGREFVRRLNELDENVLSDVVRLLVSPKAGSLRKSKSRLSSLDVKANSSYPWYKRTGGILSPTSQARPR